MENYTDILLEIKHKPFLKVGNIVILRNIDNDSRYKCRISIIPPKDDYLHKGQIGVVFITNEHDVKYIDISRIEKIDNNGKLSWY